MLIFSSHICYDNKYVSAANLFLAVSCYRIFFT